MGRKRRSREFKNNSQVIDIEQARKPFFTTGGAERSGMGFTIMESFMDTVEVKPNGKSGIVVHMRRQIKR